MLLKVRAICQKSEDQIVRACWLSGLKKECKQTKTETLKYLYLGSHLHDKIKGIFNKITWKHMYCLVRCSRLEN